MMDAIVEKCKGLKKGAKFVSLKMIESDISGFLAETAYFNLKNSWGPQTAHVYERIWNLITGKQESVLVERPR